MAYSVHLDRFDGPLDLLLHLIQQSELDIKDIFVSEITAQYLAYMDGLDALDMDTASEFLAMAATLLYIKSRQLLPRPPREDEEEEEDPEAVLIRQLRDYKAFKEAGEDLKNLFETARDGLTRLPEDVPLPPQRVELEGATMDGLYDAFLTILSRADEHEATVRRHRVRADAYTVRGQLQKIRHLLRGNNRALRFIELFEPDATRMEIIVTFMALLEMIAHGEIRLKQPAPFAEITIRSKALLGEDEDEALSYMDEAPDGE